VDETAGKRAGDDLPLTDFDDFEDITSVDSVAKGWRLEQNSNGYYRWRWQMKTDSGEPITYITTSGKTGYKRGSKYVKAN
jgi:hypothetical protein